MIGRTLGHHKITGHLGRGGMGDVYRATDTTLGREVALKILPPDLAQDPARLRRFEREARAVAALSHPNIVTVYGIESVDGVRFITMELVRGESLSALLRRGPLPLERFVPIARSLAEALAAAHERGITHRDLKPDNVMITTDGAVKVLDFGLAKVAETSPAAAPGSSASTASAAEGLTKEGRVLGTLAYMSPEQAEGKPVDARTDIFSLGVVLYELLAGRHPFGGDTTASVVAAILRDDPPPLARGDRHLPEAVDRIVRRCLEKDPARRYPHAAACAAELAELAETIGGAGAAPASARLVPLALYVPIAGAVLAAVRWGTGAIGFPDWVAPVALVLLAIGAAVLLVTALVQARDRRAWLTWRRASLGGVAAFTALGVLVGGYLASRATGIGPGASLVSSGALAPNAEMLIADVENLTEDPLLGVAVKEALSVDLAQSPVVALVPPRRVRRAMERMERTETSALDLAAAQEVAEREGIETILAGRVSPAGSGYVLAARLFASESGEVLAAFRETAASREQVIPAIDELSRKLRNRIGESLRTTRDRAPLETVTTSSLDALQQYSRAVELADTYDRRDEAAALLEEAVAIDSTFAMAYRKLGMVLRGMWTDRSRSREALTRAYELRERLTRRERLFAEAAYHGVIEHDARRAIGAYEAILAQDPDDTWALNNLGLLLSNDGRHAESLPYFRRAAAVEPSILIADNLTYNYVRIGAADSAAAVIDRYEGRFGDLWAARERMALAASQRRYADAEPFARRIAAASVSPSGRFQAEAYLGAILWTRGQVEEARGLREKERERQLTAGEHADYLRSSIGLAAQLLVLMGAPAEARKVLDEALAVVPLASLPFDDRPALYLAVVRAAADQVDVARRVYEAHLREADDRPNAVSADARRWVEGALAYFEGRPAEALALFLRNAEVNPNDLGTKIWIARVHDALGDVEATIAAWEHYVGLTDMERVWWDSHYLGHALARLGALHEAQGNLAAARVYWGQLTELWHDADPALASRVARAEERYRRLAADARGAGD